MVWRFIAGAFALPDSCLCDLFRDAKDEVVDAMYLLEKVDMDRGCLERLDFVSIKTVHVEIDI